MPMHQKQGKGQTVSQWFNYARTVSSVAINQDYIRNCLYNDSTVKAQFGTGYGNVWKHSIGQVLDPMSDLFAGTILPLDPSEYSYHLDSIAIAYRYFRYDDSWPDFINVQIYTEDLIDTVSDPGWPSGASYATVEYNAIQRLGDTATKQFLYSLGNEDTTGFGEQKVLKFPVDEQIRTGKLCAVVVTFFPWKEYATGDTIDPYSSNPVKRKRNAFLMYEVLDKDPLVEPGYFNNGLVATTDILYGNSNYWNDHFRPGSSWASSVGIYHADISFLLTYEVYQNPTSVDETDMDRVELMSNSIEDKLIVKSEEIIRSFEVRDLSGKIVQVSSVPTKGYLTLDTSTLNSGIYLLKARIEQDEVARTFIVQ